MNIDLLKKHIDAYKNNIKKDYEKHVKDLAERKGRIDYYRSFTKDKILAMTEDEMYNYISKLWAMLIWGNKKYVVEKLIQENGFDVLKNEIAELVWGKNPIIDRWNSFRKQIKGIGPAMISEILCHVYPSDYMVWNRRAYVGLNYLGVKDLPRYNYQLTGKKYKQLSEVTLEIAEEMKLAGISDVNLIAVDYFMWDELQVEDNLSQIYTKTKKSKELPDKVMLDDEEVSDVFIHNEIRDKLSDIGTWLGFTSNTEIKVAEGSKVDTVWEATIGNMGRVIYIFEVQTKGSIDSLIVNLLKALNNPAVQGVVAVSDTDQLDKIKKHAQQVPSLGAKLKYWDYKKVLEVHEALEMINESINSLGLVPQGF